MSIEVTVREAARLMRERARTATPGPWAVPVANVFRVVAPGAPHYNPPMGMTPPYPWRIVHEPDLYAPFAPDAAHIASWHPAVALAVADWLDAAIGATKVQHDAALAVARAYLGEATP